MGRCEPEAARQLPSTVEAPWACACGCAGLKAFFTTPQLTAQDKLQNALALGTSPIVRALVDPEGGMRDVRALDDISFQDWFVSHGGSMQSIKRMWDPIGEQLDRCGDVA